MWLSSSFLRHYDDSHILLKSQPQIWAIGADGEQAAASDVDDLFDRLERAGLMLRIDRNVKPSMIHFATISKAEVDMLRRIRRVVRRGRVLSLHANEIEFADVVEPIGDTPLYIDCTASATVRRTVEPIFQRDRIVLQYVQAPLTVLSAAMIAFIEARNGDDAIKNALCTPVQMCDTVAEYVPLILGNMVNQQQQSKDRELRTWRRKSRLDGFSGLMAAVDPEDTENFAIVQRLRDAAPAAFANLARIAASGQ